MQNKEVQNINKRENVGIVTLSSKKNNYKISSVYIYPGKSTSNIKDDLIQKFRKTMLDFLSFELIYNFTIRLFFDLENYRINMKNEDIINFPINYLIKINIIDKISKKYYFTMTLIADSLIKLTNNKSVGINLKKAECQQNEEFTLLAHGIFFSSYYIVHQSKEEWKKKNIDEIKKNMGYI